jgi:hypothetical protein
VPEGLAVGQLVKVGVGERPAPGGEPGEQGTNLVAAYPPQGDLWPADAGQSLPQRFQADADAPGAGVGQQAVDLVAEVAAAAGPAGQEPPGIAAARACPPEAGAGCRAAGAERLVAGSRLCRGKVPAA